MISVAHVSQMASSVALLCIFLMSCHAPSQESDCEYPPKSYSDVRIVDKAGGGLSDFLNSKDSLKVAELVIRGSEAIDVDTERLADLRQLRRLRIQNVALTEKQWKPLMNLRCPELLLIDCLIPRFSVDANSASATTRLVLQGIKMRHDIASWIANMRHLDCLELINCRGLSDTFISDYLHGKHIRQLSLAGSAGASDSLIRDALRSFDLCRLDVSGLEGVNENTLRDIADEAHLEYLMISVVDAMSDSSITLLRKMNLKTLEIRMTSVTDKAVGVIEQMYSLRVLDIAFTGITDEGVARLRKALPRCNIVREGGTNRTDE